MTFWKGRRFGFALFLAAVALAPALASSASAQDSTLRVFFLGRSEYGASGGIPAPFQEVCALAGSPCRGHRHWDFVEQDRANGLPIGLSRMAENRHVRSILQTQTFDAVFFTFFAYNTEFYSPDPEYAATVLDGAESLYRQVIAAGAQPFVYVGYATLDHSGDTTRIREGALLLKARLDSIASADGTRRAVFVPVNQFVSAMVGDVGADRWFADPQHPGEFGQYAIARLLFVCVVGRDATSFGHPPRISAADRERIDLAITRLRQSCR